MSDLADQLDRFATLNAATWINNEDLIREAAAALRAAESSRQQELERALEAIILRCEEGDPRTNWLPTIAAIACRALAPAAPADPPPIAETGWRPVDPAPAAPAELECICSEINARHCPAHNEAGAPAETGRGDDQ